MIEGGPCTKCGTTHASIWYGKKGEKFCKKADCLRAGGYLPPKKDKKGSVAAKRARWATSCAEVEEEETINVDLTVSEVLDIYGQRCATACHARPSRTPACRPVRTHPCLPMLSFLIPPLACHNPELRYCDPNTMEKHERRNAQPLIKERNIELLVYGIFTAFDGDKGEHVTAWVELSDVVLSIGREATAAKLIAYREGLASALEHALLMPDARAAPDAPDARAAVSRDVGSPTSPEAPV